MIIKNELDTLEKDILALYEALVILRIRYPNEMPNKVFRYQVTERIKGELLQVAQNIDLAAHNREFALDILK